MGWVDPQSNKTSELPFDDNIKQLFKTKNVDLEKVKRNCIAVFGEKNSTDILNRFLASCQDETINIDYI